MFCNYVLYSSTWMCFLNNNFNFLMWFCNNNHNYAVSKTPLGVKCMIFNQTAYNIVERWQCQTDQRRGLCCFVDILFTICSDYYVLLHMGWVFAKSLSYKSKAIFTNPHRWGLDTAAVWIWSTADHRFSQHLSINRIWNLSAVISSRWKTMDATGWSIQWLHQSWIGKKLRPSP